MSRRLHSQRTTRRSGSRMSLGMVLLLLLGTACAGPREDLAIGHKEYATDVILGAPPKQEAAEPVPVPPTAVRLAEPVFLAPSVPDFDIPDLRPDAPPPARPRPTPTAAACPAADPLQGPRMVAPNFAALPPAAGEYTFRNTGSFERGGANTVKSDYDLQTTRTVRDVEQAADGSYTFAVVATLAKTETTTTYRLVPSAEGGLSVTRIATQENGGEPSVFSPTPAIMLLQFPAEPGTGTGQQVSTDALTGTTLTYESRTGQKAKVDACGTPLDAITVHFEGTLVTPSLLQPATSVQIVADYAFATQYGGLAVMDSIDVQGTEDGATVRRTNKAVINREPAPPTHPAGPSA